MEGDRIVSRGMRSSILRKDGFVAMEIAKDLLLRSPGDRIPRVSDYANRLKTGNGTIQAGLRLLMQMKAVCLESRGHLGTYLISADYARLWEVSGIGSIMGLMPLPYSRRYEGLATGLCESLRKADIRFSLGHMRGAQNRVEALRQGKCDLIVTSRFALEISDGEGLEVVCGLGPFSYVSEHAVLSKDPECKGIESGMRVGIDPYSPDQAQLTRSECSDKDVTFVEVSYAQIIDKLASGEIDVAVWNADEIRGRFAEISIVPLRSAGVSRANTEAVIAADRGRPELVSILIRAIDVDLVKSVQHQVLTGARLPGY